MMTVRPRDDCGSTLAEMLIGMTLMGVFMAIFTPAVIGIFDWTRRTETVTVSQSALRTAMERLDTEMRYAALITQPRQSGTGWYVEYRTDNATGQAARCTRLRLTGGGVLQRISWTPGSWVEGAPWTPLATGVASGGTQPFDLTAPEGGPHRLRVRLTITQGGAAGAAATAVDFTFTALHSISADTTPTADACQEGRP